MCSRVPQVPRCLDDLHDESSSISTSLVQNMAAMPICIPYAEVSFDISLPPEFKAFYCLVGSERQDGRRCIAGLRMESRSKVTGPSAHGDLLYSFRRAAVTAGQDPAAYIPKACRNPETRLCVMYGACCSAQVLQSDISVVCIPIGSSCPLTCPANQVNLEHHPSP